MAEEQDDSQKTEEPTQRRLDEARKRGQVASSREVNHVFVLGGGALLLAALAPRLSVDIAGTLRVFLAEPHALAVDPGSFNQFLAVVVGEIASSLFLPALLLIAAAIAGGMIQTGPFAATDQLKPKLERISPAAGFKRLFSLRSLVEFTKSTIKIALVGTVAVVVIWPQTTSVVQSMQLDIVSFAALARQLALKLMVATLAIVAALAVADVAYQHYEHRKRLRMSRRDMQDEFKQSEGDPTIKSRLRGLRMEKARQRMMAAVPDATVVVTNPTHVAVALSYDATSMAAPKLVAKGVDHVAARIREVAREHGVPLVENPPLARALNTSIDIGQDIPPSHYQAVAEVIGYVMRLAKRPS